MRERALFAWVSQYFQFLQSENIWGPLANVVACRQRLWQASRPMEVSLDQVKQKRFVRGIALAWIPFLFLFVFGLRNAFRGIASSKATGLGAVAGGLAEGFAIFGFAAMLVIQVMAAGLLVRSFSKDYWGRSIVTVASLVCCGITLLLLAAFVLIRVYLRQ